MDEQETKESVAEQPIANLLENADRSLTQLQQDKTNILMKISSNRSTEVRHGLGAIQELCRSVKLCENRLDNGVRTAVRNLHNKMPRDRQNLLRFQNLKKYFSDEVSRELSSRAKIMADLFSSMESIRRYGRKRLKQIKLEDRLVVECLLKIRNPEQSKMEQIHLKQSFQRAFNGDVPLRERRFRSPVQISIPPLDAIGQATRHEAKRSFRSVLHPRSTTPKGQPRKPMGPMIRPLLPRQVLSRQNRPQKSLSPAQQLSMPEHRSHVSSSNVETNRRAPSVPAQRALDSHRAVLAQLLPSSLMPNRSSMSTNELAQAHLGHLDPAKIALHQYKAQLIRQLVPSIKR